MTLISRFRRAQEGSVTVEFVILVPLVLYVFLVAMEVGVWSMREATLRRATHLVVRDIRLSTAAPPSYEEVKAAICARSMFTANCQQDLRVEMRALPLADWAHINGPAECLDRRADIDPANSFQPARQNQLMIIRVCRLFKPILPGGSFGRQIVEKNGEYGVRVVSAFVTEPAA